MMLYFHYEHCGKCIYISLQISGGTLRSSIVSLRIMCYSGNVFSRSDNGKSVNLEFKAL